MNEERIDTLLSIVKYCEKALKELVPSNKFAMDQLLYRISYIFDIEEECVLSPLRIEECVLYRQVYIFAYTVLNDGRWGNIHLILKAKHRTTILHSLRRACTYMQIKDMMFCSTWSKVTDDPILGSFLANKTELMNQIIERYAFNNRQPSSRGRRYLAKSHA